MYNLINFLEDFYGKQFYKQYSPVWHGMKQKQATITHIPAYIVKNPRDLGLLIDDNLNKPISQYITTNTHSKKVNAHKVWFDRWFLDFDISNPVAKDLKDRLNYIMRFNYNDGLLLQRELIRQFQDLVVYDRIAEESVNEAKNFAVRFAAEFGKMPALFFSGAKGAHAYCFFEEIRLQRPSDTFNALKNIVETAGNYKTIDSSVHKDVHSRKSRIPYTKHPHTGLTVVPFTVEDSYDEIMSKSLDPVIEPFNKQEYTTDMHNAIKEMGILENNRIIEEEEKKIKKRQEFEAKLQRKRKIREKLGFKKINGKNGPLKDRMPDINLLDIFERELGLPESTHGGYVRYRCPFHNDDEPSLLVNQYKFMCQADSCGKEGNYFDFLEDYLGLNYKEIVNYVFKYCIKE